MSQYTVVPIEPNDVKQKILSDGLDLVIRFIGVELDTEVLRGHLSSYVKRAPLYGEDTSVSDVYYATNQEMAWRRLVICKELCHVLDVGPFQTQTAEDTQRLIRRMALSPEFKNLTGDVTEGGSQVAVDRLAVLYAVAITFPWRVRELVMPGYQNGKLTDGDIARLVDIPLRYVRLVLSDAWSEIYTAMTDDNEHNA